MKKRAIVFGNCQAAAIAAILADHEPFFDRFEITRTRAVHVLQPDEREKLLADAAECDLLIHQPVSDAYQPASTARLISVLNPLAEAVSFPVCWFDAYFPDMTYLNSSGGKATTDLFDYHSRVFFFAYRAGMTTDEATSLYSDDLASPSTLEAIVRRNLQALAKREEQLSVKISGFIERNYRDKCLFFTINHPTGHLLYFVVDAILRNLGLDTLSSEVKRKHATALGAFRWQAAPSIYRGLELSFSGQGFFTSKAIHLDTRSAAKHYYEFYDAHPNVVEANSNLPTNGLCVPTS